MTIFATVNLAGERVGTMQASQGIKDALMSLVVEKPYSAIKIQDICARAGVSRKTFNKWFDGKDSVLDAQLVDDFADPVRKVNAELPVNSIENATRFMLGKHYQRFYDKRQSYTAIAKSMGALWLADRLTVIMEQLNREIFSGLDWMEDRDFAAYFFSAGHAMILVWWMREGMKTPPNEVARLTDVWLYAHHHQIDTSEKDW